MKDSDKYMIAAKYANRYRKVGIADICAKYGLNCDFVDVLGNLRESKGTRVMYFLFMHHIAKDEEK